MHYPYNPGISNPTFGCTAINADGNIDTARPAQNVMPVQLPSAPASPTPTTPAPMPAFPAPAPMPTPGAFGPLPGATFPFGASPGALTPMEQPTIPLQPPTTPVQPIPMQQPTPMQQQIPMQQPTPMQQQIPMQQPTPMQQQTPQQTPVAPLPATDLGTGEVPPETGRPAPLVQTIEYTGPTAPFGSAPIPTVVPEPPHFLVPGNPLLPIEYKEILSYENLQYMNGFLRSQIGKECMVTMDVGAGGAIATRLGYLIGVGINYLLLQDACSDEILVLDFYSVRLVQLMGKRCPVSLYIQ